MKTCLIVGTINLYPAPDGWRHVHVDASPRGIWSAQENRCVPIDLVADMRQLPYPDATIDRIQCWHALEHVNRQGGHDAVSEFARVLAPGAHLDVAVPELRYACQLMVDGDRPDAALQQIYGEQIDQMVDSELQAHKWGYTRESLAALLAEHGFDQGAPIDDGDAHYIATRL